MFWTRLFSNTFLESKNFKNTVKSPYTTAEDLEIYTGFPSQKSTHSSKHSTKDSNDIRKISRTELRQRLSRSLQIHSKDYEEHSRQKRKVRDDYGRIYGVTQAHRR